MKKFTVVYELTDGFIDDFTCEAASACDATEQCLAERGEACTITKVVSGCIA